MAEGKSKTLLVTKEVDAKILWISASNLICFHVKHIHIFTYFYFKGWKKDLYDSEPQKKMARIQGTIDVPFKKEKTAEEESFEMDGKYYSLSFMIWNYNIFL